MRSESKNLKLTRGLYLQYLAQRHQEAQERREKAAKPTNERSGLVAHIRWLSESKGLNAAQIARLLDHPYAWVYSVVNLTNFRETQAKQDPDLPSEPPQEPQSEGHEFACHVLWLSQVMRLTTTQIATLLGRRYATVYRIEQGKSQKGATPVQSPNLPQPDTRT